jgi:DNA-binding protein Fis
VQSLTAAGFEVRLCENSTLSENMLTDSLSFSPEGLESFIASKVAAVLSRLGDATPCLHQTVMEQVERGLFKAVLSYTENHLGRASKILGLDRNTCARKARNFGLVNKPSRGKEPSKHKTRSSSSR